MKNLLPILVLLLSSLSLFAQKEKNAWSLEAYYTPQKFDYLYSDIAQSTTKIPRQSYSLGIGVDKKINQRVSFNFGLGWRKLKEDIVMGLIALPFNSEDLLRAPGILLAPDAFNIIGQPGQNGHVVYHSLEFPIATRLFISKGAFRLYCRPGIQPEVHYRSVRFIVFNPFLSTGDPVEYKTITRVNNVNLSLILGLGMEVDLWNTLAVFLEPEGKANLLNTEGFFNTQKIIAGARIGVRWQLRSTL